MPFFLKHHFDPDQNHQTLKPQQQDDGSVDHYELNFVQNVEAGNVIARWIEVDGEPNDEMDSRFIFDEMIPFPAGKGTGIKKKVLTSFMRPSMAVLATSTARSWSKKPSSFPKMWIFIREISILSGI